MKCVISFLSLRGRKVPRHKSEPLTPDYCAFSSAARSASCSTDFITFTSNCVSPNISITCNNVTYTQISEGNLALTTTLIPGNLFIQ